MKRNLWIIGVLLVLILALTGCQCEHEWKDATCDTPKTCGLCDSTEGAPLGHTWKAATCITPKTCETCGKKDGKALEHSWEDATCTVPKTCKSCKVSQGEALGHKWLDATTDAPKSCEICHLTEGERINTDPRFKTADAKILFGSWQLREVVTSDVLGLVEMEGEAAEISVYQFNNDGTMTISAELENEEFYRKLKIAETIEQTYLVLKDQGINKSQANAAMMQQHGVTVEEYAEQYVKELIDTILSLSVEGVYYVSDGYCYSGLNWDGEMERQDIVLNGDELILVDKDGDSITLERAK